MPNGSAPVPVSEKAFKIAFGPLLFNPPLPLPTPLCRTASALTAPCSNLSLFTSPRRA